MGVPRIDHKARIGPYLLDDILRALGSWQWILTNLARSDSPSEPLLADIMSCLHASGLVEIKALPDIFYSEVLHVRRQHLKSRLTQQQARRLIESTLAIAENLNRSDTCPYFFQSIYLFGSCLRDQETHGDVDLAARIEYRDGGLVREPNYLPIGGVTDGDRAAGMLRGRNGSKVGIHDLREVLDIGAPHKLIWQAGVGHLRDEPVLQMPAAKPGCALELNHAAQALAFAEFEARVRTIRNWPRATCPDLEGIKPLSRADWEAKQKDVLVVHLAHLACLPEGPHRQLVAGSIDRLREKFGPAAVASADRLVPRYLAASVRYNRWSLRPNGRLLRSTAGTLR